VGTSRDFQATKQLILVRPCIAHVLNWDIGKRLIGVSNKTPLTACRLNRKELVQLQEYYPVAIDFLTLTSLSYLPKEFTDPQAIFSGLKIISKNTPSYEVRARLGELGNGEYVMLVTMGAYKYVLARCVAEGEVLPPLTLESCKSLDSISGSEPDLFEGFSLAEFSELVGNKIKAHRESVGGEVIVRSVKMQDSPIRFTSCCGSSKRRHFSFTSLSRRQVSYFAVCTNCDVSKSHWP
jgi:hypothetical protein